MTTRPRCECGKVRSKYANECPACYKAKREARLAEARRIVATGKCPDCGQDLVRNSAITGWWQCAGYGAEGFRKAGSQPCSFQTFTA